MKCPYLVWLQSIQGAAANTMGYSVTDGSIRYNVYPKYRGYGPVWKNTHQKYDNLALSELYDLATDQFQLTNQIDPNGGNNGYGGEETDMYVKIKTRFP